MKSREWQRYLDEQRQQHGKVLFSVTELANVAATSPNALNVELTRLRKQGVIARVAHGLYAAPSAVAPQALLAAMDSHAYITGSYALHLHNLITQVPTRITCFTDRLSVGARERDTSVGRFVLVRVRTRVYAGPPDGNVASPAQALCDLIYITRRQGGSVEGTVTFRGLAERVLPDLDAILDRYPRTVRQQARALAGRC